MICPQCFTPFELKVRKNAMKYCSKSCLTLAKTGREPAHRRKYNKRPKGSVGVSTNEWSRIERNKNKFKTCLSCLERKSFNDFFNKHKTYWAHCKSCVQKDKLIVFQKRLESDTTFKKCHELLLDFKSKRWFVDQIDLFRLIDIWDDIYPLDTFGPNFDKIFKRVLKWYQLEKENIMKS
jgi:hypothetical protein